MSKEKIYNICIGNAKIDSKNEIHVDRFGDYHPSDNNIYIIKLPDVVYKNTIAKKIEKINST